ncbi:MAG: hypothetical protein WDW38_005887 [Sanguina aurantia]
MAGFCSFFKSDSSSNKRKASSLDETDEGSDGTIILSMPAHKLVLMAKSVYFHTRLSTAVGDSTTATIREHAGSLQELHAMAAVVEFMYTDKLPSTSIGRWDLAPGTDISSGGSSSSDLALTQRLVITLTVADRWQVRPCVAACCAAICGQKASALTWDDCSSLLNLPEGLREHRDMAPCIVLGMAALVSLANPAPPASFPPPPFMASASSPVPTEAELAAMSSQLHRLPASVRLALLKGCKLGFVGMLALLGSDDQVADSEDALATLLCNYLKSGSVRELSASQIKTLKDQLRCQHMSNAFLGFDLPSMSLLCLDLQQLSLLMYLRGLSNFDSIPVQHRQSTVPTAWYEPPRKSAAGQRNKVHLTLQISESALSEHLKHLASMKSGGKAPAPIFGPAAELNGISWRMMLASPTIHQQLWLAVQPVFGALSTVGITRFHIRIMLCAGLMWYSDALEVQLLSVLGPAVRCSWALGPGSEALLSSAVFLGMLCGASVWGGVSDVFGRRAAYLGTALVTTMVGLASALAPSYKVLLLLRCLVGFGLSGAPTVYTLMMEWLPSAQRARWMLLFNLWWSLGGVSEAAAAALLLNRFGWRVLLGVSAIPLVLQLFLYPLLPESLRYLMTHGREEEAVALLNQAATAGCPQHRRVSGSRSPGSKEVIDGVVSPSNSSSGGRSGKLARSKGLLRSAQGLPFALFEPGLQRTTASMLLVWFVCALCYYGTLLLAAHLGKSEGGRALTPPRSAPSAPSSRLHALSEESACVEGRVQLPAPTYADLILASVAEIPSVLFCAFVANNWGRKSTISAALLAMSAALLMLLLLSGGSGTAQAASTVCFVLARFSVNTAFSMLYVYTNELYPTQVRAVALGFLNTFSRLGGLAAPYIAVGLASEGYLAAALLILASLGLTAALVVSLLPVETVARELDVLKHLQQRSAEAICSR